MHSLSDHSIYQREKNKIETYLSRLVNGRQPRILYSPVRYVLSSGGKRLRGVLVLLACEAVGGSGRKALHAAAAMEILHNFTLVHDDVMDDAEVRRNRPTVHLKWDQNVAILAGDELVAFAYKSLLKSKTPRMHAILRVFTDAFIQVCEGKGLDKEIESRSDVRLTDYLMMIGKKTARIIAAATEIGGLIGEGSKPQIRALRSFGFHLGTAFQIQDDLLDVSGSRARFGKNLGGDIARAKKTFLLLKAIEFTRGRDREFLRSLTPSNGQKYIDRVSSIYRRSGALGAAQRAVMFHSRKARESLFPLPDARAKDALASLAIGLVERQS